MTQAAAPATTGIDHPWKESYWPIHAAAVLYMLVIGGFSVDAWLANGEPFRAAMCAGAQVLAVVCAILARRAFTAEMYLSAILSLAFAAGCAFWAGQGLQHAWEENGQDIEIGWVVFLAALEPGLFLLAEHIEQTRAARRDAEAKAEAETAAELKRVRERQDALARAANLKAAGVSDLASRRHGAVARVAGAAGVAAFVPAPATAARIDVAPPAFETPAARPEANTRDIDLAAASRFGDAMAARGETVTFRALAMEISAATKIDPKPVKSRLERLFKAHGVRIGERWPKPRDEKPLSLSAA